MEAIAAAGYTPGDRHRAGPGPGHHRALPRRGLPPRGRGPHARRRRDGRVLGRAGATATRSSRSRTAWPRRTGTAGSRSPSASGDRVQLVGDDLFVTNSSRLQKGIELGAGNAHPDQAEPDRHAVRDARRHGPGEPLGLRVDGLPPLGRDRGHLHRRPRRRDRRGADQDRGAVAQRARGQVQPAHPDRGAARPRGLVSRDGRPSGREGPRGRNRPAPARTPR